MPVVKNNLLQVLHLENMCGIMLTIYYNRGG